MTEEKLTERVTVLEHTVVSQNSAITTQMRELVSITKEIGNKLDAQILSQTKDMVKLEEKTNFQQKEIDALQKDNEAGKTMKARILFGIGSTVMILVISGIVKLVVFT